MRTALLLIVVLCGCTLAGGRHSKSAASIVLLATSTALLACDAGQTMAVAADGWPGEAHEGNWMLGREPSASRIAVYNSGVMAANAGLWAVLTERHDWIAPLALSSLETLLVARNMIITPRPFCGIK